MASFDATPAEALLDSFSDRTWRVLGAVAVERVLGQSACAKLFERWQPERTPSHRVAATWLQRCVDAGVLVAATAVRPVTFSARVPVEDGFSVAPWLRERVLRRLAGQGELPSIATLTGELLGARSGAPLTLALQRGSMTELAARFPRPPRRPAVGPASLSEWLRASICDPFDADWFERTWRSDARLIAERVLEDALSTAAACSELYAWALGELALGQGSEALASVSAQHALLRGEPARFAELLPRVARDARPAYTAAGHVLDGNVARARDALAGHALGTPKAKRERPAATGALAPILALLLCSERSGAAIGSARRWMAAAKGDAGAQRAARRLFDALTEPEPDARRIDVHQIGPDGSVWERLLFGFCVHLLESDRWVRAAWAEHLASAAADWVTAGYAWLGVQAGELARALDAEYAARAPQPAAVEQGTARGRLWLWDLVTPVPEWQRALEALERAASGISGRSHVHAARVAFAVDMTDGRLVRPLLQEFRAGEGWSDGRRLPLDELWDRRAELPLEDRQVLEATVARPDGTREFSPEAVERLIGHPRVVDAMRGRSPVEVIRGTARLRTQSRKNQIELHAEPLCDGAGVFAIPESPARLVVYRVSEALFRVIDALPRGMRVPVEQAPALTEVLGQLADHIEIESDLLGRPERVEADPRPCLRFSPRAGAWQVEVGVSPFGPEGRFFLAGQGPRSLRTFVAGRRMSSERDFEAERARYHELLQACPTLTQHPQARAPGEAEACFWLGEEALLGLLSELRAAHLDCALQWPASASLRLLGAQGSASLHGQLRSKKGWYLLTGGLSLDAVTEVALSELVTAPALAGGRFVRLPSGDYVELEQRIRRVIAALKAAAAPDGAGGLRLHRAALPALSEAVAFGEHFELDADAAGWLERATEVLAERFEAPPALDATLRSYQLEGYRWLRRLCDLGIGACLADEMGLGKTLQVLAVLVANAESGPALVVTPTSVTSNWVAEARRFAPTLSPLEYAGPERQRRIGEPFASGTIVICSYALLQQDAEVLSAVRWGTVVLDEAQFIKNARSRRARAAFALQAGQRIAATGTPIENHLGDLWSIFRFLNPGLLGSWQEFRRRFQSPVDREASESTSTALKRLIRPFVLRRTKRDVLTELPPVTEVELSVQLTDDERLRYALLRKQIHERLYDSAVKREHKLQALAEIMRLRRFCCHPRLVFPDAPQASSKVQAFLELAEELVDGGHRALVFSQFVDFLSIVREHLHERNIAYVYLDGSTPASRRAARVRAFQDGDASLFLISLKAGGFGLNLTAADYVIHLDPWWNPATESQATDRAHRIGQERPVTVYRLVAEETIERRVIELHARKRKLADGLLRDTDHVAPLTTDELVGLLGAF